MTLINIMRTKNNAPRNFITVLSLSCLTGLGLSHAQTAATAVQGGAGSQDVRSLSDTEVLLQAIESVPPAPAASAPRAGTFFSAQHAPGTRLAWPPLPGNYGLPVWNLGDGVYLLDDLQVDYSLPVSARMAGGGMGAMDDSGGPFPGDGGGGSTNDYEYSFNRPVYTTNDLWLEITGLTNTTAFITIHEPWNVTNGVYDLFYTTNLSPPQTWSWVLRSFAGLTNLTVNNAVDPQGFYRLGQTNDLQETDSLGTNFWVAFFWMWNYYYDGSKIPSALSLYISSPVGASGAVTIPGLRITNAFTVAAGAVTNMSITNIAMIDYYSYDAVETNGIHVTASQPVAVYAMNYTRNGLSAAFTAYPTNLLGTNYCLMARPAYCEADSEFGIVATANNTTVTITPSPTADLAGSLWNNPITLQQGQTYQINSIDPSGTGIDDVTGTRVTSDKPIAVFAGASAAFLPVADGNVAAAGNPLMQEQLPVESWGTQTLGLSFAGRTNGDSYRVLAAYNNTVVSITGTVVTITNASGDGPWLVTKSNEVLTVTNDAGVPYDIIVEGPIVFQASQPIQVAQFGNGEEYDHGAPSFEGDQCEILLPPTGHYLLTNTVVTTPNDNTNGDFDENVLNVIVPQSAITNTFVDTVRLAATNFVAIGTSGYYGTQFMVTNSGTHRVTSSRPVEVQVYGWGNCDAYSYFGGWVK